MLNQLFLWLHCTKAIRGNSYLYDGPTHDFTIEPTNKQLIMGSIVINTHEKEYKVDVYDGSKVVSSFKTTNLWSLPKSHKKK